MTAGVRSGWGWIRSRFHQILPLHFTLRSCFLLICWLAGSSTKELRLYLVVKSTGYHACGFQRAEIWSYAPSEDKEVAPVGISANFVRGRYAESNASRGTVIAI